MRYCDAACRSSAFRSRAKARVAPQGDTADLSSPPPSDRSQPTAAPERAKRKTLRRKPIAQSPPPPEANGTTTTKRSRRIPFDRQVLGQAPSEAVAYRLALPARSHAALPRIAPAPDAGGHLRAYGLNPFELPSDVRLRHDQVYRILWVGPHGEPVPAQGTSHLPALHFFLGPAEADSSEADDEYEAVLRGVSDPELRRQTEAEVVRLRLTTLHQRQEAALRESELDLLAAELRLWNEQAAVTQELLQEQRDELERLAAQQREQQEATREAHAKAEMKSLLSVVAVVLGIPAIGTAVAALQRKLDGDPMDWSKAVEQVLELVQHLATNFTQHGDNAKPTKEEIKPS